MPSSGKRISKTRRRKPISTSLYVVSVYLSDVRAWKKPSRNAIRRVIEIRGDQTLDDLHEVIFEAYDRYDEHLYEFQLGSRPFDDQGPNFEMAEMQDDESECQDAGTSTLGSLGLKPGQIFGYLFDFGDSWYHQILVERIDQAQPRVTYPRIIKRIGGSPPQYEYADDE